MNEHHSVPMDPHYIASAFIDDDHYTPTQGFPTSPPDNRSSYAPIGQYTPVKPHTQEIREETSSPRFVCDGCKKYILDFAYHCTTCENFDYCSHCFIENKDHNHEFEERRLAQSSSVIDAKPDSTTRLSKYEMMMNNEVNLALGRMKSMEDTRSLNLFSSVLRKPQLRSGSEDDKRMELEKHTAKVFNFEDSEMDIVRDWIRDSLPLFKLEDEVRLKLKAHDLTVSVTSYVKDKTLNLSQQSLMFIPTTLFRRKLLQNIEVMDLSINDLDDIPESINNLVHIRELNLSANRLSTLPKLASLSKLVRLELAFNQFVECPTEIFAITTLEVLDMRGNKIRDLPSSFTVLQKLAFLNLDMNPLSSVPACVEALSSLLSLQISEERENPKTLYDPAFFADLNQQLEESKARAPLRNMFAISRAIDFTDRIQTLPEGLSHLPLLCQLKISQQLLHSFPESGAFSSLQSLNLLGNNFTSFPPSICNIPTLVDLTLANNKIASIDPNIARLTNLNKLVIGNNCLEQLPDTFSSLQSLGCLVVHNNKLRTLPNGFYLLTKLDTLVLDENPLPDAIIRLSTKQISNFQRYIYRIQTGDLSIPMWLRSKDLIPKDQVTTKEHLGNGIVFHGTFKTPNKAHEVAVKLLKQNVDIDEAEMEMGILARLRRHPNTVYFYGFCENPLKIVMEYIPAGSLKDNLARLRCKQERLTPTQIVGILLDSAIGMRNIHLAGILHQDLHTGNVLLSGDLLHAKIGDFGLSRLEITRELSKNHRNTRAPEVWIEGDSKTSAKADVFAFHVIMWEAMTGEIAYQGMTNNEVEEFVLKGYRLPAPPAPIARLASHIDNIWHTHLVSIMRRCGQANPDARPTFADLTRELEPIAKYVMGGHEKYFAWQRFLSSQDERFIG